MTRTRNSPGSEWDDDEEWDEDLDDFGPDGQSVTTDCIHCGAEIYDDTPHCPICGEYQTGVRTGTAWSGRPWWWRLGGIIGIIAVLLALLTICL